MTKIVAVIGRPNVGKSTFFNQLAGRRISITFDKPGVTRDRIYADVEWCGYSFTAIDTGGIELKSEDKMWKHIRAQAELAVEVADAIIFMCDGKEGVLPDDYLIAEYLRMTKKPVILAVNKLDNPWDTPYDFYELGLGDPYGISAEHSTGIGDVLDAVVAVLGECEEPEKTDCGLKIAVVGKPNAGKSSLVNKLIGKDRSIVSDIAGTTRDAIDINLDINGYPIIITDTAGIRETDNPIEKQGIDIALQKIQEADGENICEKIANCLGDLFLIEINRMAEECCNSCSCLKETLRFTQTYVEPLLSTVLAIIKAITILAATV